MTGAPSTLWPQVQLGAICEVGSGNGAPQGETFFENGKHPFVRMQDVGRSTEPYIKVTADRVNDLAVEKHGLRLWPAGAVLIPKSGASVALNRRAILSEPSYVVSHLAILVPGRLVLSEFLYFLLCQVDMMRLAPDPGYPSLKISELAKLKIPLPPLSEQRRIVDILQEAEAVRRLRAQAQSKTNQLIPAIFEEMFGDVFSSKTRFKSELLGVVGELDRGKSKHRPRDEPSLYGGCHPFLQTGDIASANGWVTDYSQTYSDKGLAQSRMWPKGTLAITIAANIGATAILTFDACFPDSVVGFTPSEKIRSEYVRWWLMVYQKKLEIQAPQGAQKNINLKVLRGIQIPIPPIPLQDRFRRIVLDAFERDKLASIGNLSSDKLVASLSAHAFSGELTRDYREAYAERLAQEARERDDALKEAGATVTLSRGATKQEEDAIFEQRTDGIYAHLSSEQRSLFREIKRMVSDVNYIRYFTTETLAGYIDDGPLRRNPKAIEGHLCVLAARGIIIPVSREKIAEGTAETVFGNAFRLPLNDREEALTTESGAILTTESGEALLAEDLPGDKVRLSELERLGSLLERSGR